MTELQRLAHYVQPPLSEARIQAQWSRIAEFQPRTFGPRLLWAACACAATAACIFMILHRSSPQSPGTQQLVVERNAIGMESISFPEGVTVSLQREARYRVLERSSRLVHLRLEQGGATFDVTPGRDRRVVITAAEFDVEVIGTRFEVALLENAAKPDVSVKVQHGTVRVRPRGTSSTPEAIRTLSAGESWSTRTVIAPRAEGTVDEAAPKLDPPSALPSIPVLSAKELFESAESHRLKGRLREAASEFDRLRRGFPRDPRAGLAAFELGRLRMDQLGDRAGALNALSDALRLDPSARFSEDAQARIVQLYGSLGQIDRCRRAKSEYQSRYPSGPHAKAVASVCAQ